MTQIIAFTKVKLPYSWLGNMASYPIEDWPTSEHLFQALRFAFDSPIRDGIKAIKSPMAAKMHARSKRIYIVIEPLGHEDVENMRSVLRLKLRMHPNLHDMLLATGGARIIEDVTRRQRGSALFWGAALINGEWEGKNVLGKLWEEIRFTDTPS